LGENVFSEKVLKVKIKRVYWVLTTKTEFYQLYVYSMANRARTGKVALQKNETAESSLACIKIFYLFKKILGQTWLDCIVACQVGVPKLTLTVSQSLYHRLS
jgi:hypothetical protein